MRSFVLFVASAGYAGYFPIASGTVGSAVAIPIFWAFSHLHGLGAIPYVAAFVLSVAFACWVAGRADAELGEHDSSIIVIDEVVGYLAATLFLAPTWSHSIAAFFLFRFFDVVKPYPASHFDRNVSGGAGVVLDDVVAGFYANLAVRFLFAWIL